MNDELCKVSKSSSLSFIVHRFYPIEKTFKSKKMNTIKSFLLTSLVLGISLNLNAQNISKDTVPQKQLIPVQAFAAMPVLFGVSVENAFPHDRKYQSFGQNQLTLPLKNGQNYSIFGSLPVIRKRKGFSAKVNFAYDIYKDNIGATTLNERVIVEEAEETATSANVAFNISQEIPFKKWKKKLTLSGTFSASGQDYGNLQTKRGIVSAIMPLKMTRNSMFTIGALGIIGKNINRPVLPIIAYFTRLGNHTNLEMILPISSQIRYVFSAKSSIRVGARIGSRTPFLDKDLPIIQGTDDALEFKSQNLRFYLNAEKALGELVWLNAEIGYNRNMKSALITPNLDLRNKLFVGTGFNYTYAKVGLFLRPVFGSFKRQKK